MFATIPKINSEFKPNLVQAVIPPRALTIYGFSFFVHKMRIVKMDFESFKGKTKVYRIMHPYELEITDHADTSIASSVKGAIKARNFYKLWELQTYYDIIHKKSMAVLIITNKKGIEESLRQKNSGTKFDITTILIQENAVDLTKVKVKTFDLCVVDYNIIWTALILQEQHATKFYFTIITTILSLLSPTANVVFKIYETFTSPMIQLLAYITTMFDESHLCKPYISRFSSEERYFIGIKRNNKQPAKEAKEAKPIKRTVPFAQDDDKIPYDIRANGSNLWIQTLFDVTIPKEFTTTILAFNTSVTNQEAKTFGLITAYIRFNENYFGPMYHAAKELQIEKTKEWIEIFVKKQSPEEIKRKITLFIEETRKISANLKSA